MPRILFALLCLASEALAYCPYPTFDAPATLRFSGGTGFFVTHASGEFDPKQVSKPGIDETVAYAKAHGVPVVYLHEPEAQKNPLYFYGDCQPTYWVQSYGGEFSFTPPAHVLSAGGFFENCKERTVQHVFQRWASDLPGRDVRLTEVMAGSYQLQGWMDFSDPYYAGYRTWVERTGSWAIPVSGLMGIIGDRGRQLQYLYRYLGRNVGYLPANYRVAIEWDGAAQSVYRETGPGNPTLTVNFVTRPDAAF